MPAREADLVDDLILAERTGWTLDYIQDLDMEARAEILKIYDALDKAKAYRQKRGAG